MSLVNYKSFEKMINFRNINSAYFAASLAGTVMLCKFFFSKNYRKKNVKLDEKSRKRRKIGKKSQKFFDLNQNSYKKQLKFTSKNSQVLESYSKMRNYTETMLNKVFGNEKKVSINSKTKKDYIFFKLFENMQERFNKNSQISTPFIKN